MSVPPEALYVLTRAAAVRRVSSFPIAYAVDYITAWWHGRHVADASRVTYVQLHEASIVFSAVCNSLERAKRDAVLAQDNYEADVLDAVQKRLTGAAIDAYFDGLTPSDISDVVLDAMRAEFSRFPLEDWPVSGNLRAYLPDAYLDGLNAQGTLAVKA